MAKYGAEGLANHVGSDIESIREYEYQPGQFTQKIFVLDETIWCPYKTKAKECYNCGFLSDGKWAKVQSSYDDSVTFWEFIPNT